MGMSIKMLVFVWSYEYNQLISWFYLSKISTTDQNPNLLSTTLVVKYQMQTSIDKWLDSKRDIPTLIKWAINCDTPCLNVSIAQILHRRLGNSWYRLKINTLNKKAPRTNCTITDAIPNISHELLSEPDL